MTTHQTQQESPASHHGHGKHDEVDLAALIDQAEALRSTLRATVAQTSELLVGLKRQRKQTSLVRSTLASLRQLQQLDA